jgi:hypothetical protein
VGETTESCRSVRPSTAPSARGRISRYNSGLQISANLLMEVHVHEQTFIRLPPKSTRPLATPTHPGSHTAPLTPKKRQIENHSRSSNARRSGSGLAPAGTSQRFARVGRYWLHRPYRLGSLPVLVPARKARIRYEKVRSWGGVGYRLVCCAWQSVTCSGVNPNLN